ncbi:MAG: TPM domain-containing protein [Candidatus Udaeobacter sp.]
MRTKEFLSKLDHDRIIEAIRDAESKTSGEIRVFIQRGKSDADPVAVAQKKFQRLGMYKTRERNAVLIFVAPRAHKFAVVGDEVIHKKCGEQFWHSIVDGMRIHFQNEKFSHALAEAIHEVGKVLATHFPRTSANPNELLDEIVDG